MIDDKTAALWHKDRCECTNCVDRRSAESEYAKFGISSFVKMYPVTEVDADDRIDVLKHGFWGASVVSRPEYQAEQKRRNAEIRAVLDKAPRKTFTRATAEAGHFELGGFSWGEAPSGEVVHGDKPIDIMAVTRRMCK